MSEFRAPQIVVTVDAGNLGVLVVEKLMGFVAARSIVGLSNGYGPGTDRFHSLGIDVREANYDRPESLDSALAGVDRFLFVSPCVLFGRQIRNRNVIEAARRANVKFVAFTSGLQAAQSPFGVVHDHLETEKMLRELGIAHAAVRNNWCEDADSLAELEEEMSRQKSESRANMKAENAGSRTIISGAWCPAKLAQVFADLLNSEAIVATAPPAFF